jgi:hypothetical protein
LKCGCRGSGGSDPKKIEGGDLKKKNSYFWWQRWATVEHVSSPSTNLRSSIPVRDVGTKIHSLLDFTNFHFTSPKTGETSWSFTSRK